MQQINHAAKNESRPGNVDEYILTDRLTSRGMLFPYRNAKTAQDRQGMVSECETAIRHGAERRLRLLISGGQAA
jgi:hypothetical protein